MVLLLYNCIFTRIFVNHLLSKDSAKIKEKPPETKEWNDSHYGFKNLCYLCNISDRYGERLKKEKSRENDVNRT